MSLQIDQNYSHLNSANRISSKASSKGYAVGYQTSDNTQGYTPYTGGTYNAYQTAQFPSYQISGSRQLYGSGNNNAQVVYQNSNLPFYGYQNQGQQYYINESPNLNYNYNAYHMPFQALQGSNSSRGYVQQAYAAAPQYYTAVQPQQQQYIIQQQQPIQYRLVKSEAKPEPVNYQVVYNQQKPVQQKPVQLDQDWRLRCQQIETQYHSLLSHCREMEHRISITVSEKEKLKAVLLERNAEIDKLKYESANVSISVNEMRVYQSKIIDLESKLAKNIGEIESWQMKYYDLQKEFTILESSKSNESVDRTYYEGEIRRLRELFEQKSLEIEEWKIRANRAREPNPVDTQLRFENERLQSEILSLKSSSRRFEDLEFENSRLKTTIEEYRMKISTLETEMFELRSSKTASYDLEAKIALLTQEIERLNSINYSKTSEIESLRLQTGDSSELIQMRQLIDVKNVELEELRQKVNSYEMKIALLTQEIERLNNKTGISRNEGLRESIRRTSTIGGGSSDIRRTSTTVKTIDNRVGGVSNTDIANQIVRESLNKTSAIHGANLGSTQTIVTNKIIGGTHSSVPNYGGSHLSVERVNRMSDDVDELRHRGLTRTSMKRESKYY